MAKISFVFENYMSKVNKNCKTFLISIRSFLQTFLKYVLQRKRIATTKSKGKHGVHINKITEET